VINTDPHNKEEKSIVPVPIPQEGIMWDSPRPHREPIMDDRHK